MLGIGLGFGFGRRQRDCFHHDRHTGRSWITAELVDLGRRKMFRCYACGRIWFT